MSHKGITADARELIQKVGKKVRQGSRRQKIWLQSRFSNQNSTERFIFHHIPKCGGTTALDALTHWYIVRKDFPPGWSDTSDPPAYKRFCDNPINLSKLDPNCILVGHFHVEDSYLHQRYPEWEAQGFKLITFVRDPLELQVSQYKYEVKMKRIEPTENLEHRLMCRPNWISERLPCTESNYEEVLNRYGFIATMDDYQRSFDQLAEFLGKPKITLKRYNSTANKSFQLSDKFISEFKDANALDYKIYEFAQKRESLDPVGSESSAA